MQLTDYTLLEKCKKEHDLGMDLNNARELGGYVMQDGRVVKRGLLLRTTRLCDASERDLKRLSDEFKVACILDMRGEDEAKNDPDPEIPGARYIIDPIIGPEAVTDMAASFQAHKQPALPEGLLPEGVDPAEIENDSDKQREFFEQVMKKDPMYLVKMIAGIAEESDITGSYTMYLKSEFGRNGFRLFFKSILETEKGAVLWHCLTGKDRTGIGAALLLQILGADWDTILMDYEVSNLYFADRIEYMEKALKEEGYSDVAIAKTVGMMAGIHPDMLIRAWDYMKAEYGSVEGYIKDVLGLTEDDFETLRSRYLEEV